MTGPDGRPIRVFSRCIDAVCEQGMHDEEPTRLWNLTSAVLIYIYRGDQLLCITCRPFTRGDYKKIYGQEATTTLSADVRHVQKLRR
jgi:hypothetical protein